MDDTTLCIIAVGEQTDEIADLTRIVYEKIYQNLSNKINTFVDLNEAGKNSPKARKLWKEINENELTGKVAVYGVHAVAKVIGSFVIGITNKEDIRFFSSKDKALKWLKS